MAIRIKPQLEKSWSNPDTRRYGVDQPLEISGLSTSEQSLLQALEIGFGNNQLDAVAKLCGVEIDSAKDLVQRLKPVLSGISRSPSPTIDRALRVLQPNDSVIQKRLLATVFIPKLDQLGRLIVLGLAESGIGRVICNDNSLIKQSDCGETGYPRSAIGIQRLTQLRTALPAGFRLGLDTRLRFADYSVVDAALVVSDLVVPPDSYQRWLSLEIPHLSVCFSDYSLRVSAMIYPGKTPCLSCRSLQANSTDAQFSTVAPQLTQSKNNYRDFSSNLMAAAIATERLLATIDGQKHTGFDFKIDHRNLDVEQRLAGWTSCGCQIAPLETETVPLQLEHS